MQIQADASLLRPFTKEDGKDAPVTIRCYSNGEKNLYYINANHVQGTDNATCDRIKEAIGHLNLQHVVVEASDDYPLSPDSEVEFTHKTAREKQIPVTRGEPADAKVFADMRAQGYSTKDVMALYLVRSFPQRLRKAEALEGPEFNRDAEGYFQRHPAFRHIPDNEKLTYEEFRAEYLPRLGKPLTEFKNWDVAPLEGRDATYFQKMNAMAGRLRDEHLVSATEHLLNQPDTQNVLVVFGDSHRAVAEPVWEKALGKGVDVNPAKGVENPKESPEGKRGKFGKIAMVAGAAIVAGFGLKLYLDRKAKNTAGQARG